MANFKDIGVNKELLKSIQEMGFETPTPIQKESIPCLLTSRQDLISLAQTGTGKTAAFGLPIIQQIDPKIKHVQAIVLCPTRELCIQIAKDLIAFSKYLDYVKVLPVYGGTKIENQIKSIKKGIQIIVGTPGRTKDLIKRKILKLDIVNRVVLDEADEMLSMGFKDDLDFILDKTSNNRQTMLFSATMSKEVISISKKYMKDAKEIAVAKKNSAAKNVEHHIYDISSRHKYEALKRIADYNPNIYGIVFCRTRRQTKEITNKFINDGYNADAIHGDLSQGQRDEVMSRFRDKSLQMLIATDVAARGLDVEDLTHIINYSLPDDPEIYTHRSGRTGRAGKSGISIAISNSRESRKIKSIENKSQIKFLKKEVPTGKDICSKQLFKLIEKIEKVKVDNKQIEPYLDDIYKKLEWLSREDLIKHFVSAEFNRFLEYYKNSNNINNKEVKSRSDSKFKNGKSNRNSFVNYSISIGRKKGISPIELISLINRVMKSNQIEIGKIDIRGDHTIFEMDKSLSTDLSKGIKKINFRGNDLSIKETDDKIEARPSKQNRNRSHSSKNKRRGKSDRDFKSSGNSRKKRRKNRF
ncbi:MAG: DEAD/DEAH box helicase [Flavobacteriaceae bacterium]|jgi:ATP-dependent RNA helicase DeaD|nr:DEAD/DEAH box helicase [Flavobacteriaceae bacterium]MBT4113073.1 DEAD/DEAH box helicase [Flavobacteriaceae bacterium]MBT4613936.1 DEAD/DEAH box helicase [Flavobacteriaceae bacterium]MBT5246102.1 DEAD/DEAH box helicase [Flavobacteriaceae bacterium]MBT5650631.1 DEAD/DEAH box helicase [Flavobacteriaceae bacterium]